MDTSSKIRLDYLDNLKWVLIIIVIFHHAGQAYGTGGGWAYTPSNPGEFSEELWRMFCLNAGFMMGLFFLISGYFTPRSYDKHGFAKFMNKKLVHIGIPTAFVFVFISLYAGRLEIAHAWYLFMLLVFSSLYGVFRLLTKGRCVISSGTTKVPDLLFLSGAAILLSAVEYFTREAYYQDYWVTLSTIKLFEPVHLPQYILMYLLGIHAYRKKLFEKMTDFTGIVCLAVAGIIAFVMLFCIDSFGNAHWWATESFFCISVSFGLVWFFRKVMNFSNRLTRWCARQEYGVYLFHLTNMLFLQHLFDGFYVGGGVAKMLFIGVATTVFTFVTVSFIRMIPGVKKVI